MGQNAIDKMQVNMSGEQSTLENENENQSETGKLYNAWNVINSLDGINK